MRKGGDSRGSSASRRARKVWMLNHFGNGLNVNCVHCGKELDYTTVESDRIIPGNLGGSYRRDNVQPACRCCNARRADDMSWTYTPVMAMA